MTAGDKILVIGINSFLGKKTGELLVSKGYYVIGAYHQRLDSDVLAHEFVQIAALDTLNDRSSIQTVFIISAHIPYVASKDDNRKLFEANVALPEKICSLFSEARLIFCSSVSLYEGLTLSTAINEDIQPKVYKPYALSKLWAENIIQNRTNYAIIRFSSIYGVGMNNHTFIPRIVDNALSKNAIALLGSGERLQNYIHVIDAANILLAMIDTRVNGVFLGAGDQSYSNVQIAQIIQEITGSSISFTGEDCSISYQYNNEKVRAVLGEEYQFVAITKGLEEIVTWKKEQY